MGKVLKCPASLKAGSFLLSLQHTLSWVCLYKNGPTFLRGSPFAKSLICPLWILGLDPGLKIGFLDQRRNGCFSMGLYCYCDMPFSDLTWHHLGDRSGMRALKHWRSWPSARTGPIVFSVYSPKQEWRPLSLNCPFLPPASALFSLQLIAVCFLIF